MSEILNKRPFLEKRNAGNIALIKSILTAKENIPPKVLEAVSPAKRKLCSKNAVIGATTPKKSRENLDDPVTPSSNFKLLTSLAASLDYADCDTPKSSKICDTSENQMSCDSDMSDLSASKVNRKEKSLAIICTRFLSMFPMYPKLDEKITISLDETSVQLCVERRRLYDIVNVFESIDILTKIAKNQYLWFGKNYLYNSLCNLKVAALKENLLAKLQHVIKLDCVPNSKQPCLVCDVKNFRKTLDDPDSSFSATNQSPNDSRKEKSLGIMSQRFLMLFLVSPNKVISLGVAAKVLNGIMSKNEKGAQVKTQVRRLYDIANVLSSIGLIQKESAMSQCGRKPAFKYIGPDLTDYKGGLSKENKSTPLLAKHPEKPAFTRHSSFQEICAVAEIEHKKLNLEESPNSAPPFDSTLAKQKEIVQKTSFENLPFSKSCNKAKTETDSTEIKHKSKTQYLLKPNMKLINLPKSINPALPYYIINNAPSEKSDSKPLTNYGSQTYLLINTVSSAKDAKLGLVENISVSKPPSPSPQTVVLSSQQRDAILKSLNISLSSEQIAAIHLDGASQPSNSNTPLNVLKIINKNKTGNASNIVRLSAPKELELNMNASNAVNNTRSNSPSSIQAVDSPFSIPSGYVTPIPSVSSDISFVSNLEVNDILKKIESQSNFEGLNKLNVPNQDNVNVNGSSAMDTEIKITEQVKVLNPAVEEKEKSVGCDYPRKDTTTNADICSKNQATQLISNDSCSSDSVNLEVSSILNSRNLSNASKPKSFLIDEKTLLSPIRTPASPLSLNLITPPYIAPETIFFFGNHPVTYQTAVIGDFSKHGPSNNGGKKC